MPRYVYTVSRSGGDIVEIYGDAERAVKGLRRIFADHKVEYGALALVAAGSRADAVDPESGVAVGYAERRRVR